MKIVLFAAFIGLATALPRFRQVLNLSNPNRLPGEFLIVLHAPTGRVSNVQYASSVSAKIASISSKITVVNSFTNLIHPILHVKTSDESVMTQFFQIDEVDIVESNLFENMLDETDCESDPTGSRVWGLSRVGSRAQPVYSTATYSYGSTDGNNVKIYIVDTGIRITHQDFGGRAIFGANFADTNNNDGNGHGTHCAGTAGGTEFGVSKGSTVVAVKVLGSDGSGTTSAIVAGINWCVGDVGSGLGVISMSLGGSGSEAWDSAVNDADAANIPSLTSSGNSNIDACTRSPARATGCISVSATDSDDGLASYSNYGTCVDILAPGSNILSAIHTNDSGTSTKSGTSMACPHVAGLVANYLSDNPNATSAQVKEYLADSATPNVINMRGVPNTPNLLIYSSCD